MSDLTLSDGSDIFRVMERELRNHLLALFRAFCDASGKTDSMVAYESAGDRLFYQRIRAKSFTVRKYDRVVEWFSKNWPEGIAWPDRVSTVSKKRKAA